MANDYSAKSTVKKTPSKKPTPKHKFEGHECDIWSFVFFHDDKYIVSSSEDGTMRKWDCETGLPVGEPWERKAGQIWALALSPNGNNIACGGNDGRVQHRNTDGVIKDVWMGHKVLSVSWSPSGCHIASGSCDGTILIRKADGGKVEVGPIETGQDNVYSLTYSSSGDRIASSSNVICIWDSNTGELLVGPIKNLGAFVTSVAWSSDSSKLYSASDKFARVFDSVTGAELHRFSHNYYVNSVALSPKDNLLACVGFGGTAQLWDTESYQPLGKPFSPKHSVDLNCVSFSRDGRYLAYGGSDENITLWMVKDIVLQIALPAPTTQEETLPEHAPLPHLDVDATNPFARPGGDDIKDGHDNPYDNFFQSSHSSLHSPSSGSSPTRRLWGVFVVPSLLRTPANESVQLKERLKRGFLTRGARSSSEAPANKEPIEPTPDRKVRAGEERNMDVDLPDCSANMMPGVAKQNKGKPREDLADAETLPPDDASSTAEFDTNENRTLWKFLRARKTNAMTSPAQMTHGPSTKAVEVYTCRKHQGHVAWKPKRKANPSILITGAPTTAAQASGSSQADSSSHGHPAHGHTSSLGQAGVSSQSIAGYGGQSLQVTGGLTTYSMDDFPDSGSTQGSCNRFLDRICFPCGHYEDD